MLNLYNNNKVVFFDDEDENVEPRNNENRERKKKLINNKLIKNFHSISFHLHFYLFTFNDGVEFN